MYPYAIYYTTFVNVFLPWGQIPGNFFVLWQCGGDFSAVLQGGFFASTSTSAGNIGVAFYAPWGGY